LQEEPLRYLEVILGLLPDSAADHWLRAMLRLRTGDAPGAKQDLEWLMENDPDGIDMERVKELYRSL
jgi:regulator of sirC expression with transglutaminase-like and TPR domain